MIQCRCEPHASGSNRCDACRYEMAEQSDPRSVPNQLISAVTLISQIAEAPGKAKRDGGPAPHVLCDRWLEANGYACEASRRRQREQRAVELDTEIERLRAERAKL